MMITLFLAEVLGWYCVMVSLLMFFRHEQVRLAASEVMAHRGLFFVLSIFTFILGLIMVISHNIWVMGWPVVVTLMSWLILIGAIWRLVSLDTARQMGQSFINHSVRIKVLGAILLLIGVFLLLHVYYLPF